MSELTPRIRKLSIPKLNDDGQLRCVLPKSVVLILYGSMQVVVVGDWVYSLMSESDSNPANSCEKLVACGLHTVRGHLVSIGRKLDS